MKTIAIFLLMMMTAALAKAQEQKFNNRMGIGVQVVQYQNDFGIGMNVVSPYFVHERIAVRLKTNLMYNQNVIDETTEWIPYTNLSVGLVGVGGYVNENIRLYGEGGIVGIFPSADLSSEKLIMGGYGLFGFEFFFNNAGNYFIEIGGVGTGAVADKINLEPIYSNGMTLSAGVRFFLQ